MGIRKEIKAVIRESAGNFTSANEAINLIANIVNRPKPLKGPKPLPSRAALAEEAIAAAQEHAGECTERTGPQATKPLDPEDPSHPILILTATHHCKRGAVEFDINYGNDTNPVTVALAIGTLRNFCKEVYGVDTELDTLNGLIDVADLLKKF